MEAHNQPTFAILALPKLSCNDESTTESHALAHKFRNLRLDALRAAPEAFASSYEVESQRDLSFTLQRLSNPKALHFVAVLDSDSRDGDLMERLLGAEWTGMVVLLGPDTEQSFVAVSARGDPFTRMTATTESAYIGGSNAREGRQTVVRTLHYHLNGMFVRPSARKSGLGRALIEAALTAADTAALAAHAQMKCSVLVDSTNQAARGLYKKAGFVVVGRETYVQQPRTLVTGESHAAERVALLMELYPEQEEGA